MYYKDVTHGTEKQKKIEDFYEFECCKGKQFSEMYLYSCQYIWSILKKLAEQIKIIKVSLLKESLSIKVHDIEA